MLPFRLSTVSVSTPGSMASLGAVICFSLSAAIWASMSRMLRRRLSTFFCMSTMGTSVTMPSAAIEQIADTLLAVLARFRPQRRQDELVAAGKLLRFRALQRGILQHGIDRKHELSRLLVGLLALARVFRRRGRRRRRAHLRGRRCAGTRLESAGWAAGVVSATLVFEISSAMPSRSAVCAKAGDTNATTT